MDSTSTLKGLFLRVSFTKKNIHQKLSYRNTSNTTRGFNKKRKYLSWPRINCHLKHLLCSQASNATHLDLNLFWQLDTIVIRQTLTMLTLSILQKRFSNNHIQRLKATIRYLCLNRTSYLISQNWVKVATLSSRTWHHLDSYQRAHRAISKS